MSLSGIRFHYGISGRGLAESFVNLYGKNVYINNLPHAVNYDKTLIVSLVKVEEFCDVDNI